MTIRIYKSLIRQKVLIITLLLLALPLSRVHADDEVSQPPLPKYEIVKKATEVPPAAPVEWDTSDPHYEYDLKLEDNTAPLFLACGFEGMEYGAIRPVYGFDPDSFKLRWLLPGKLLHATWETVRQGQGGYPMLTHLLIENEGGKWRTIFKDSVVGYSRSGWDASDNSSLEFVCIEEKNYFLLTVKRDSEWCWYEHIDKDASTLLATRWEMDDGKILYRRKRHHIERYPFTIENGTVTIEPGKESFDLEDQEFPLKDVAAFLGISEEKLIEMNPRFKNTSVCSGEFLIRESIPPREPDTYHHYSGCEK